MTLLHDSNLIAADSAISELNSTVGMNGRTPLYRLLTAGETWVGTVERITGYTSVAVAIVVDQPGSLGIEYSMDNIVWDFNGLFPVPATGTTNPLTGIAYPNPTVITSGLRAPWLRVKFINNGSITQTVFRLQTMLNPSDVDTGSSRVANGLAPAALARTVKAFAGGFQANGTATYQRFTNDAVPRMLVDAAVTFPSSTTVTGTVAVSNFPASVEISNDVGNAIPVSGTFWQTTQPVSLASVPTHAVTQGTSPWVTSVSNFPATQPVSGTFWQATQPVSGTFWQATQPVSLASVPTHGVTQSTSPWVVSGAVTVSNFPATQPVSGTVAVTQSTSPWVVSLASTTVTGTVAVTQSTSPWVISGTVTANDPLMSGTVTGTPGSLNATTVTANQVVTTYTVPVGKTLYLGQGMISGRGLGTLAGIFSNYGTANLQIGGVNYFQWDLAGTGNAGPYPLDPGEPIPVTAGTVVRIVVTPNGAGALTPILYTANLIGILV